MTQNKTYKIQVETGEYGNEWVDIEYATTWKEVREAGWEFQYQEHDTKYIVMTRNRYLNRFRTVKVKN